MITFGGMAMMAASLVGYHSWAMAQPSTRGEVSQAIAKLEPACKPIVQARFRARLVDEGRPLTRSEVKDITKGIRDCDTIDQQIAGLREG